jgi:hypothetical protein
MMSWLVMLIGFAYGGTTVAPDLASLIDAEAYFKSRRIEINAGALADLAGKSQGQAKAQIEQLLAIRWLGDHADEVKKDEKVRTVLQNIAAGAKTQDPLGFAKEYAQRALARIDGKPVPLHTLPEDSVRTEGLKWFAGDVTFLGGIDYRSAAGFKGLEPAFLPAAVAKVMPAQAMEELFKFAEEVGNLQADRFSFAISPDPNQPNGTRIYLRFSGRGDRQLLAEFFKKTMQAPVVKEEKPAQGEPITLISQNGPPALALIGNSEMIVAGYESGLGNNLEVVQDVLDVRAGRKASLVAGPLADELKSVPSNASGLLMGEIPEHVRKELTRGGPFKAVPYRISADVTREKDLAVRCRGTFGSAADAKAFTESVAELRKQASDGLKQLPPQIKLKPKSIELLTKTLEGIKMEPKDSSVSGGLQLSGATLQALQEVMEEVLKNIPRDGS